MVKVYAVSLVLGVLGLIFSILGSTLMENLGRPERDPNTRMGTGGRMLVGGLAGFGMAGMSAEFAPLGLSWQVSLLLALVGAAAAATWVGWMSRGSTQ